jgi:maltose alpha-D-glucosyltransferase/alpha-amylase
MSQAPGFPNAARWVGEITCSRRRSPPICLAVVHQFVPNEGGAWQLVLDELSAFFERVTSLPSERAVPIDELGRLPADLAALPKVVLECVANFPEKVRLIGKRLAELHIALSSDRERPEFAPEEFSPQYRRSIYQSMRKLVSDTLYQLMVAREALPSECQPLAQSLFHHAQQLEQRFHWVAGQRLESQRIRCHGDCHLGQLLFNGKDFVFIDFEGSPLQSLGERRIKRSPLRDVASMIRSMDYAALSALRGLADPRGRPVGAVRPEDLPLLSAWTDFFSRIVQQTLVTTYREHTLNATFSPPSTTEFNQLLDLFLFERMLIELEYELTYRPSWLVLPLQRLVESLTSSAAAETGGSPSTNRSG